MSIRSVYFHEDDFCQIELLPAENWEYCQRELQQIATFSQQHRASDGIGWTDIYVRKEAEKSLSSLSLATSRVAAALARHLPAFDLVETGYGSHVEQSRHTKGFGVDSNCVLFVSETEVGIVNYIWLSLVNSDEGACSSLLPALGELNNLAPLLMVDWTWGSLMLLDDSIALGRYFSER